MSQIQPYRSDFALTRDSRRAARAISHHHAEAQVQVTKVDATTDVALAKVDALTAVTGSAMAGVIRVTQAQRQLEALAPEAAGRLAFLADDHLLGMGEVLADLRHDLRRK